MSYDEARQARETITGLRYTVRRAWEAACKHDEIPPDSAFVLFSEDNPFVKFHDKAMAELRETLAAAVPGGGYVGLRIRGGKAVT